MFACRARLVSECDLQTLDSKHSTPNTRLQTLDSQTLDPPLQHRDAAGAPISTTLSIGYDWASGRLTSHRVYWQRGTALESQPADDSGLARMVVQAVDPPAERWVGSVGASGFIGVSISMVTPASH
jgi:hypothetical protein